EPKASQAKAVASKAGPPLVAGRVLDLEGKPIAGATVRVERVQSPPDGKLDAWIDEVKRQGKRGTRDGTVRPFGLPILAMPGQPRSSATTGPDGRFRLEGLPRDGIVTALITGPGIETAVVYILTRDVPTFRVKDPWVVKGPMIVYYGEKFDHVVERTY